MMKTRRVATNVLIDPEPWSEIEKQRLHELIEAAFRDTPPPLDGKISLPTYDDEGTHDYFSGSPWQGHSVSELRTHESAFCFFTADAFRYYLPAFMLAELKDPETADVIAGNILFHFTPPSGEREFWRPAYEARLSKFSEIEKKAIAEFLRYVVDGYGLPRMRSDYSLILERLFGNAPTRRDEVRDDESKDC